MGKKSKKSVKFEPKVKAVKHESRLILFGSLIVLLLASFSVYANALTNGFVYDDNWQVLKNEWIKDVKFIPQIFSESVWAFETGHLSSNYYRPFMHSIYMINYHIFGLSPWGFHLINILFHYGVTVLVFFITFEFLEKSSPSVSKTSLLPSLIAALLFATHPIHTEAVTWVAGIPDLSFTFFSLLSFYFYARSQTTINYFSSIVSFSIAVFCKEPALTLPIFFVAYDYFYRKDENRLSARLARYIPFLSVAIIYLILRSHALGALPQNNGMQN